MIQTIDHIKSCKKRRNYLVQSPHCKKTFKKSLRTREGSELSKGQVGNRGRTRAWGSEMGPRLPGDLDLSPTSAVHYLV